MKLFDSHRDAIYLAAVMIACFIITIVLFLFTVILSVTFGFYDLVR
jgi:hypothetical protein